LIETPADTHEELLGTLEDTEIAREYPVIVLSEQIKAAWAFRRPSRRVRAVLPREVVPEQLRVALEAAAVGTGRRSPSEVNDILPAGAPPSSPIRELPESLTRVNAKCCR